MAQQLAEVVARVTSLETLVHELQTQTRRCDDRLYQLESAHERRFSEVQDAFTKLSLGVYEAQAELARVRNTAEHVVTREREAAQLLQTLQTNQETASEWIQRGRQETSDLQAELGAWKEQGNATSVLLAGDIQGLAKESATLRASVSQQNTQWLAKLETLQDTMDRQSKLDKAQLSQRLEALNENQTAQELRMRGAVANLLKDHARIREAIDQGMSLCSSEVRTLNQDCKATRVDHHAKLDDITSALAEHMLETSRRHDDLRCSLRALAIQLNISEL